MGRYTDAITHSISSELFRVHLPDTQRKTVFRRLDQARYASHHEIFSDHDPFGQSLTRIDHRSTCLKW